MYDVYTCFLPSSSSGVETASHAGHCPINLVNVRKIETAWTVYEVYGEQDKSGENSLVVGSMFPHL